MMGDKKTGIGARGLSKWLAFVGLLAAAVVLVIWPATTEAGGPVLTGGGGPRTPAGPHSITITGQSGSLSHSSGATLVVE